MLISEHLLNDINKIHEFTHVVLKEICELFMS